jgi:coenzyme F420 hydrogenase subunit beta
LAIDEPVEVLAHAAREECNICVDYSAELADIAVGAIGSASGWSTVLTRTPRGEDILNGAVEAGYLEMKRLDPAGKAIRFLETLCERKRLRDPSAYIRHTSAFARPQPKLMPLEVPAK